MKSDSGERYRQRWLVYLDILGYREMVQAAADGRGIPSLLRQLRQAIDATLDLGNRQSVFHLSRDAKTRVLGDAVYVTTAATPRGALRALRSAASLACMFALQGLFVRGGIARGGHFDDGSVLLSPALVAAHELETLAVYPRVAVGVELLQALQPERRFDRQVSELLRRDNDGMWYVHYLQLLAYFDTYWSGPAGDILREYLPIHKAEIERRRRAAPQTERVHAKYEWLASYHNRFCSEVLPSDAAQECSVELCGFRA